MKKKNIKYKYTTQPARLLIREWRDEQDRRCTSFIGMIFDEDQAEDVVKKLNLATVEVTNES